jgi:hypothetical protein
MAAFSEMILDTSATADVDMKAISSSFFVDITG